MPARSPPDGKSAPRARAAPAARPKKSARKARPLAPTPRAKPKPTAASPPAARLIDERIRELGGWRGETLARVRALIRLADPEIVEEWKWSVPVWSRHGIVCTGEAYAKAVKLTFARGASLPDPSRLFNASLEGNTRRAIDVREGQAVDAAAFQKLVKAAVAENAQRAKAR